MRLVCSKKHALVLQATCSQIQFLQYVKTGKEGVFASWKHQGGEGLEGGYMLPTCAGGLTSVFVVSQGVQDRDDVPHYLVVLSHLQTVR